MAKRSVLDHPKFTELQEALEQPKGAVLGWLECLWHFTAKFTPQGNVGKYSDKQIERWLEWDGETGELIRCLVKCGWVDESDQHRLIVHDWHDHCDDSVKKTLKRLADRTCPLPVQTNVGHVQTKTGQITDSSRLPVPSLAMPSHAEPAPDDPPPENPFEHPKPLAYVDPIARFPVEVAAAAREAHSIWHHWAHGGLPNLHSESTAKDLNRLAAAEESQPGSILTRIKGYVTKTPSGYPRNTPLFKVLNYLGYDPPLVNASPKVYSPPTRKHENITEKRLAAQNDGQSMIDEGIPLEDVMSHLISRYGEEMARSTIKAAGWRKTA